MKNRGNLAESAVFPASAHQLLFLSAYQLYRNSTETTSRDVLAMDTNRHPSVQRRAWHLAALLGLVALFGLAVSMTGHAQEKKESQPAKPAVDAGKEGKDAKGAKEAKEKDAKADGPQYR